MLAAFSGEYYHIGLAFIASDSTAGVTCRASPTDGPEVPKTMVDMITVDS